MRELGSLLGILQVDADVFMKGLASDESGLSDDDIEALIVARKTAKAEKNWAESDRIRDELLGQGVVLEDSASGTIWRRG